MENMKDIREKRNAAIQAAKDIEAKAKDEKRSLNDKEIDKVNDAYAEATRSDKYLTALEAKRSLEKKIGEEDKRGKEADKKKESRAKKEHRALNSFLKTQSTKELRDIDPTLAKNNGAAIIPESVDTQIIDKLTEDAPVVNAVRLYPTANGSLTIAKETNPEDAGFVGEGQDVSKINEAFDTVKLDGKRVGAYAQLTEELTNDTQINLVNYTTNRLSRSLSKTLERAILLGASSKSKTGGFNPIVGSKDVKDVALSQTITTEDMLGLYASINPAYLNGAMFVVSRRVFNQIIKLKDGDNSYLIFRGIVDGKPGASFRGIPVYVSDVLNGASSEIVFGNLGQGYGMMQKQGINIAHVTNDTQQVLNGGHLIVISGMFDGTVINADALVTASLKK